MRTLARLAITVLVASIGLAAIGVAVVPQVVQIVTANHADAADLPQFTALAQRSVVYDAAGNVIDIFKAENREPFKLSQVPKPVIDAVLAVEDESFYVHKGVNLKSLVRAMLVNVSEGEVTQGGSTITQQLVKNSLLTSARDADRKILEAAYAVRLEQQMSKDQILERYLNTIYLGNNAYGFQAAAETYFGKNVDQLDVWEGAFLAGLIRNPSGYDPIAHPERARARFRQAVDRLVAVGEVTKEQGQAMGEQWPLPTKRLSTPQTEVATTYFSEEVRKQLLNDTNILGDDQASRYNKLYRGGLKIYTTLNPQMQADAEAAVAEQMPDTGGRFQASLAAENAKTGAVLAMVGGRGFGESQVNLAVTPRQTGSSAKLFILLAALQAGVQPNDTIDGTLPCTLPNPGSNQPFEIDEGVSRGVDTVATMTALSINCAYSKLAQIVGLHRVVDTAKRLGVKSDIQPYAAFATGANEISPLDFATSGATISNGGVRHDAYYVERIEGPDGQVIYQHSDPGTQAVPTDVANRAIDVLKGVIKNGTVESSSKRFLGTRPAAGKTGTYEDNTNATFVGFTTQLSAAVWLGNPLASGTDMMRNIPEFQKVGVPRVHGGNLPYRVWEAFIAKASQGMPEEDWAKPDKLPRGSQRLYLPDNECPYSAAVVALPPSDPTATNPDGTPVEAQQSVSYSKLKSGTTIAPDNLDPTAPVGAYAPSGATVASCTAPPKPPPTPTPTPTPTPKPAATTTPGAPTSPPAASPPATQPPAKRPPTSG
ncbi:MAG TPA: transglycosylase domain-containing protein [Acidimicrobiales bacterium]|nr:transglycosylase domain-containing protein [Acidimicrobiales bacterium]